MHGAMKLLIHIFISSRMTTRKADPINEAKNLMIIQRIDICAEAILDKVRWTLVARKSISHFPR